MADYLKIPEVARRLDVSEPTVRRMVKGGKLPSVFIGGAYRVNEEDLAEYIERARVIPGKAETPSSLESSLLSDLEHERRREPKVVTDGAALRGAGRLRAEGFVLIGEKVLAKILERTERGEISAEEAIGEVHEEAGLR